MVIIWEKPKHTTTEKPINKDQMLAAKRGQLKINSRDYSNVKKGFPRKGSYSSRLKIFDLVE